MSGVTTSEGHQGQVQLYRSPVESVSLPMLFKILFYFLLFFIVGFFLPDFVPLALTLARERINLGFLCHGASIQE